MHIKVISTVVFASLAAAIAVPPFNGKTPPSTSLPPPPGPPPSGVPPSGVPPTGTPLPKPSNATDQSLGQHKDNDGNNHLPRGDGGLLFPTNFPHLSLPTGKTPPPTSLSPPPGPPPSGVPPSGVPPSSVPPSGTPLPKPSNANDKSFGQHKDTGSDGNTHHPRGDGDLPLLPTNYPHLSPPTGKTPPPTSLPPPPGPPPSGVPPSGVPPSGVPPSGVPPSGTPLPKPSNDHDQSLGQHKDNDGNNHLPRGDGGLPFPTNFPHLSLPTGKTPPPTSLSPPPGPPPSGVPPSGVPPSGVSLSGVPPSGTPLPKPSNAKDKSFGQHKDSDGNNHLPRGDGDLPSLPTNIPHLSPPIGKIPPPTSLSPPPGPPPTGVPPIGTPLPQPSNANDQSLGQHKDNDSDNAHHPRGDPVLPSLSGEYHPPPPPASSVGPRPQ